MRLLSTEKLELKTFPDRNGFTPEYAILSHCWSDIADDEVLFADIQNGTSTTKKAYPKLAAAMKQAREWTPRKYEWIWCDTCCINKESSAELSEAINSMYAWYAGSGVCLAYIEDQAFESPARLKESKWFTRGTEFFSQHILGGNRLTLWCQGWTLQELIGPSQLFFYDANWKRIGSKSFPAIRDMVSDRTGISTDILEASGNLQSVSIAQRMSWAAHRSTTRPEDRAYCLMGIFQVNMPMLYGEGALNAFHRLQEQIMKDSNDHSIFAWTSAADTKLIEHHGLLADSPDDFVDRFNMVGYADWEDDEPFQPSNRGLKIDLHLTPVGDGTFYAALNCPIPSPARGYYGFSAVMLKKLASGVNQYTRVRCHEIFGLEVRSAKASTVYVRQKAAVQDKGAIMPWHFFQPRELHLVADRYDLLGVHHYPLDRGEQHLAPRPIHNPWFAATQASAFHIIKRANRLSAILYLRRLSDQAQLAIILGSMEDFEVGFDIAVGEVSSDITAVEKMMMLRASGTTMEAGSHKVRIDVTAEIDTPRKLYVLDITIDGQPSSTWEFRPPPANPQELVQGVLTDIATDVQAVASDSRYRPMSILRRARKAGG